jgi:hypothetical protein
LTADRLLFGRYKNLFFKPAPPKKWEKERGREGDKGRCIEKRGRDMGDDLGLPPLPSLSLTLTARSMEKFK